MEPSSFFSCLLVDDEPLARMNLKQMLENFCPELTTIHEAENISQARTQYLEHLPDVIFLDINMPGESGFDLFDLSEKIDSPVIFVTAHREYALQAIKQNAVDYLLKPIDIEELQKAVEKAIARVRKEKVMKSFLLKKEQSDAQIKVHHSRGVSLLRQGDIVMLEAESNYSRIFLADGSSLFVAITLKRFEEKLSNELFFRPHRSFIINMNFVEDTVKRGKDKFILLENGTEVKVSDSKYTQFLAKFNPVRAN